VNSSAATLTVTTTLPTLFGLSAAIFYGSILLIVIVVAVGLLVRRHRREAEREAAREAARQAELRAAVPGYRIDDPRLEHARGRAPPPP